MDKEMTNKNNEMTQADGTRELSPDEMDRISGGADFWPWDTENRRPGEKNNKRNKQSN